MDATRTVSAADPARSAIAVTPDNDTDLTNKDYSGAAGCRALYIGSAGDVEVITLAGDTAVFANVPVGILPIQCTRVKADNTTASSILALY